MSNRQRRIAGAGVAGVAAVFAVAPFANAAPSSSAGAQPSAAPTSPSATTTAQHAQPAAAQPAATTSSVTPNFGIQKIRVGVQIKSGAWVPPGTNTGGTTVGIVETGPNEQLAAQVNGTSCQTVVGSEAAGSTETYCSFGGLQPALQKRAAIARAGVALPADAPPTNLDYVAFPGDTVTFTQTTVNANLVIDPQPQTVQPCVVTPDPEFPDCPTDGQVNDVTFNDAGLPPAAEPDSASVVSGKSVSIDVLANDTTHGAPADIVSASKPRHGSVTIDSGNAATAVRAAASGTPAIVYKSDAGYVGTDSFTYTMSTPNGTSSAKVTVTVLAPPPTAVDDTASTTSGNSVTIHVLANDSANGGGALHLASVSTPGHGTAQISDGAVVYTADHGFVGTDTFTYVVKTAYGSATATVRVTVSASLGLAATGSNDGTLADLGLLLLLTGGAATVVGRRRYRAKHAGLA